MSKRHSTLMVLSCSLIFFRGVLLAQHDEEMCIIMFTEQNRSRTVAGTIDVECPGFTFHDPPFGNWGVISTFADEVEDEDQFRGWKHKDGCKTKLQWNSCTTHTKFEPGQCDYYNSYDCETQYSPEVVTHGRSIYLGITRKQSCMEYDGVTVPLESNFMELYELDSPDKDEFIERLTFPRTELRFEGCRHEKCPEITTEWMTVESSSSTTVQVEAELRITVQAILCKGVDQYSKDFDFGRLRCKQ